jgi:hypothetical protein
MQPNSGTAQCLSPPRLAILPESHGAKESEESDRREPEGGSANVAACRAEEADNAVRQAHTPVFDRLWAAGRRGFPR